MQADSLGETGRRVQAPLSEKIFPATDKAFGATGDANFWTWWSVAGTTAYGGTRNQGGGGSKPRCHLSSRER